MSAWNWKRLGLGACVALTAVTAASAPAAGQAAPGRAGTSAPSLRKTAWGDPDLQGMWRPITRAPFQRPRGETRELLTDAEIASREEAANRREQDVEELIRKGEYVAIGDRNFPVDNGIFRDGGDIGPDGRVHISRRTSAIVDPPNGRLPPWTAQQLKKWEAREAASAGRGESDSWEDRTLYERCINIVNIAKAPAVWYPAATGQVALGPATDGAGGGGVDIPPRQIIQSPGYVAFAMEAFGEGLGTYRVLPVTPRPPLGPAIRQWQGDARGRWEGNTLVVEIANVNGQQNGGPIVASPSQSVFPGSGDGLKVTERYTLLGPNTLELRATISDPETYTRPYTAVYELTRDDDYLIQPFQCHEKNRSMGNALAQARADERSALEYGTDQANERRLGLENLKRDWAEFWKWAEGK